MTYFVFALLLVVLKFVLKLSTARSMKRVDIFRAFLGFPLDLAFLGLSFGVVYIGKVSRQKIALPADEVLVIFLAYIVFACLVAFVCRWSDVLFNRDENGSPIIWTGANYIVATAVLAFSVYIQ